MNTENNENKKAVPTTYNLLADKLEFVFVLRHNLLPAPLPVNVVMKPYDNREMIQLLKERAGHMQQAKDDIDAYDVKEGQPMAARDFFTKYNIEVRAAGKVLNDIQIQKLDARYGIRDITIDQGYNGISRWTPEIVDPEKALDIDALLDDAEIVLSFALVGADGIERTILIPQIFQPPTAMDSLTWNRAQIQQGLRHGGFRVQYDHEKLDTLYNKLIRASFKDNNGAVLGETPCTIENKEEWIDSIPYLFKRAALQFLFARAERATRGN